MADGLDDLRRPLDPEPTMREWLRVTQGRNLDSLNRRQGPGGAPLVPNAKTTVRLKKHDRVGFRTGAMAAALTAPNAFTLYIGGGGARAEVYVGQGATVKTVNLFIRGQRQNVIEKTSDGKTYKRKIGRVPPRDFVGVDERDVDAAAEHLLAEVGRQWGFTEQR